VSEELLNLAQAAAPRDTIRLPSKRNPDGKSYEILSPSDLGAYELERLRALSAEEDKLRASAPKALKPAQKRALRRVLGEAVKLLMPSLEPAVLELLSNEAREQILIAWMMKHYSAGAAGTEGEARSRRTTAASSRGSKRSTAATRKRGSTSRSGR
jgi:hypothetical protein